jgi:hypothetical protein
MRALFPSAVVWSAMVWYAMLELHIGKGVNEKPTRLHQHDARGRYRLPHSCRS